MLQPPSSGIASRWSSARPNSGAARATRRRTAENGRSVNRASNPVFCSTACWAAAGDWRRSHSGLVCFHSQLRQGVHAELVEELTDAADLLQRVLLPLLPRVYPDPVLLVHADEERPLRNGAAGRGARLASPVEFLA